MITIYTNHGCPHCEAAKRYITQKGGMYEEKPVMSHLEEVKELIKEGGRIQLPVIVEGETVITGYNPEDLDNLLNEKTNDTN